MTKFIKNLYTANPSLTKSKRFNNIFSIAGYIVLALFPAACFFVIEYIHYADKTRFIDFISERTRVVFFVLVIFYLIYAVLLLLVKRGWIAASLFGLITAAVSVASFYKFNLTGDYFYPWDLVQASNVSILMTYLKIPFPLLYVLMIAALAAMTAVIAVSRVGIPVRWYARIPAALILASVMAVSVSTPDRITEMLNNNELYLEDMALQVSNYQSNGFSGATVVNILSGSVRKPENYSKESISDLLNKYEYIPASADYESPDIIIILSESFWDIRNLPNTAFSTDPLENFDKITERENCYSGRFFTTGFGGGTVRPEFELLTGLTTDNLPSGCVPYQYIHSDFECYIRNYKELGYSTFMLHPYLSSFYMRKQTYGYLGFDDLYFHDELLAVPEVEATLNNGIITDDSFVDYLIHLLENNGGKPSLAFGITMENHQPYPSKYTSDKIEVTVECPTMDEETLNHVTQFTQGIINADRALMKLVDYIDSRERPTVLVYFGDHAPSLGSNYAAYAQSGMIESSSYISPEERLITQSTPYLIYSNYDIDNEDAMIRKGKDNDIASYNVLNALATLIESPRTRLMQYLRDFYETAPYYNIRLNMEINPRTQSYISGHDMITYDRISGSGYSLTKK